jgi:hypothetical protein
MSVSYYIIGCVLAGLCGMASGIILACAWMSGRADVRLDTRYTDRTITQEEL